MTLSTIDPATLSPQTPALPVQVYQCPNCKAIDIRPHFNFCPMCGFELDTTPILLEKLYEIPAYSPAPLVR